MARILTTQTFCNIGEFVRHYGIVLPKPREDWRLMPDPCIGHIHGLPGTQGRAIATNGVLVAVERVGDIFLGHLENFVPDEQQNMASVQAKAKPSVQKRMAKVPDMTEYLY